MQNRRLSRPFIDKQQARAREARQGRYGVHYGVFDERPDVEAHWTRRLHRSLALLRPDNMRHRSEMEHRRSERLLYTWA